MTTVLRAHTRSIADPGDLLDYLPATGGQAWIQRGEGMVGIGEVVAIEIGSIDEGSQWWAEIASHIRHDISEADDVVGLAGCGPIAFGTFCFDPANTRHVSRLVVPRTVVGRRGDRAWVTTIADGTWPQPQLPPKLGDVVGPGMVSWSDGTVDSLRWQRVVADAVGRIRGGAVEKVVLAREMIAEATEGVDPRWLLRSLTRDYARTWAFWVDDMVGASPEMLVRSEDGLVTSRVLAGTIWKTDGLDAEAIAAALSESSKDLAEHEYAVQSVANALAPYCSGMNVPDSPYVLELPNVSHLATDVTGVAKPHTTSLQLAAALHPSAAVCGTPTAAARQIIADIEQLDRGRYSGPVGWVDAAGDGEWAIALRCGRIAPDRRRLHAFGGCGIVADSDPAQELAESNAKLVAIRDAIG